MPKTTVALFGANGTLGNRILHALIAYPELPFNLVAFIRPESSLKIDHWVSNLTVYGVDLTLIDADSLSSMLAGVDVVVSAVGSAVLPYQHVIQDAAAKADVRRFYPSSFGMPQVVRFEAQDVSMINSTWDLKMKTLEAALKHPAICEGRMTYTVINNSECFDAAGETIFCPWLDTQVEEYNMIAVGDSTAKMDYISDLDVAAYLVESIQHPEVSENQILFFQGYITNFEEVAQLLRKHSGKTVTINLLDWQSAERIIRNPNSASSSFPGKSKFSLDFIIALRHVQGQGRLWMPKGQTHNHLFPNIKIHTVDERFSELLKSS
ncbi:hypothetical protein BFJ72_g8142 [Fusarium proliferatum]|uniref:NmrA-like domain-containing protein n=1 Tax=Gibberella intermedia TaxID=948311 RepID=A0A420T4T0_GIBIN|nr:hypothetical protein BFJ72_g8142 [Fusarium proliferatum]